jgi:hypothetical protein
VEIVVAMHGIDPIKQRDAEPGLERLLLKPVGHGAPAFDGVIAGR